MRIAGVIFSAIFAELERKLGKLKGVMNGDARVAREHLVETEQAADCLKIAAAVDPGLTPAALALATTAHDSLCLLKHDWVS